MEGFGGGEVAVSEVLMPPLLQEEQKRHVSSKICTSNLYARERKLVCVTSGNSYLGFHLVKALLARGYLVRVTIQNEVDFEDLIKFLTDEELNRIESVVVAKTGELSSLCNAFRGSYAVFHTSSFIDPHGVAGYSETMAFLESEGAKNVIEACGSSAYVKRCIFTSSLLAAIWRREETDNQSIVDESFWSDEEFCRENKLWLALGKTKAEKIAWAKSKEMGVKLVTVCPGLLMAPSFPNAHIESCLPYLKGGKMMLQKGFLAVGGIEKVVEAHVRVYEAMDDGASGRYLCFDKVIRRKEEAIMLENGLNMQGLLVRERNGMLEDESVEEICGKVSNSRVAILLANASHHTCKE
ncbi:3-beta hydroxysteroid dehydrogenase/isomerase [Dillenia turbinata]|uniref:3-beta hydroxysteroid dehydrogenase/isomerase n=1 Tax=Dillenia turbinata TaxID=194707 RepID=A0AAN8VHZ8_9MAGN